MAQLLVRQLGLLPYLDVWQQMKNFTDGRSAETPDELWLVEHPKVFTQGQAGKSDHILEDVGIPIVQSDRGGQVTYHAPGQLVVYLLIDLKRRKTGVRELVTGIENSIVRLLASLNVIGSARREAPGVYVEGKKVAALGLRVRKGCSYHGLSLNVDLNLAPFQAINPCGYQGLEVTRLVDLGVDLKLPEIAARLVDEIQATFEYDGVHWQSVHPINQG